MKGQKPILTVADLMSYLSVCPQDAHVFLMPEDGEGFLIGGVLEFSEQKPQEVWILIDEFSEREVPIWIDGEPIQVKDKEDIISVRGSMKSA